MLNRYTMPKIISAAASSGSSAVSHLRMLQALGGYSKHNQSYRGSVRILNSGRTTNGGRLPLDLICQLEELRIRSVTFLPRARSTEKSDSLALFVPFGSETK